MWSVTLAALTCTFVNHPSTLLPLSPITFKGTLMLNLDTIALFSFSFCNLIVMISGLRLLRDGLDMIFRSKEEQNEGILFFLAGCVVIYCVASVAGMAWGVVSLGAMINDFDMRVKVKQLLKEGKIYDYSLREATNDAQEMANEYRCRAYVIDVDNQGDFDVVLNTPDEDVRIMRVCSPKAS